MAQYQQNTQRASRRIYSLRAKITFATQSIAAFHGDLHGNVHALNSYLASLAHKGYLDKHNPFRIIKDNFYLIFLGDYVDRGDFGVETIYTILRLKIENPDHVFMVRGNHEDLHLMSAMDLLMSSRKNLAMRQMLL